MKSELIVDVHAGEARIALLEDSRLVQLQRESTTGTSYSVGDIYLAKVKKLMPGLNAAFVNVGYEKDAFLHYLDLGPNFATYAEVIAQTLDEKKPLPEIDKIQSKPEIDKHGTIPDQLQPGQELLVQIVKEPISSKGPRLTTEVTFTGRNLVLVPFANKISVSQKISTAAEKVRLRRTIETIKPDNFGVIIRTSAEGKKAAELNREMRMLLKRWSDTLAAARKASAPALVHQEEGRAVGVLRDVFNDTFEAIHVNDNDTHAQVVDYLSMISPEKAEIVKLYTGEIPIFDHFNVTKQIKSSFGKTVSFRSGAYIIIEHTEALHVIDVNSGNRSRVSTDQENNALEVNLRAADEIARQLRLRDMGGIIVIDFIDMAKPENRQKLFEHMRQLMDNDRARHNILQLSKFGLMQITRQRVRPDLEIETTEKCPSCGGKGEVAPSLLFTDTLHDKLDYCINVLKRMGFTMYVHPYVDAFIKKGFFSSLYRTWRSEFGRSKFKIIPDQSLGYLEYKVIGADGIAIDLREEKDIASSATKNKRKVKTRNEVSTTEDTASAQTPANTDAKAD
jgi:ribonuclease G